MNDTIHKIDPNDESTWPPIAGKSYLVKAKDVDYWIWYYHAKHDLEDIKRYTHWHEQPPLPEEDEYCLKLEWEGGGGVTFKVKFDDEGRLVRVI